MKRICSCSERDLSGLIWAPDITSTKTANQLGTVSDSWIRVTDKMQQKAPLGTGPCNSSCQPGNPVEQKGPPGWGWRLLLSPEKPSHLSKPHLTVHAYTAGTEQYFCCKSAPGPGQATVSSSPVCKYSATLCRKERVSQTQSCVIIHGHSNH